MSYKFYLDDMLFPLNPSKLTCKYSNKNKTAELINGTEINILKQPGLTEFAFEALIPASRYPYANYDSGFKPLSYYLLKLKKIKESNQPVYFKVLRKTQDGGGIFDTDDFKCTLEDYSYTEDAKEGFDVLVSVKLKGYNDYSTAVYAPVVSETAVNGALPDLALLQAQRQEERPTDKQVPGETSPQSYTVQEGDTTLTISRKVYGNDARAREIGEDNRIANPNTLKTGQTIRLGGVRR